MDIIGNCEIWRGDDSKDGQGNGTVDVNPFIPQVKVITALLGKQVQAIAAGPGTSCAVTDAGAL